MPFRVRNGGARATGPARVLGNGSFVKSGVPARRCSGATTRLRGGIRGIGLLYLGARGGVACRSGLLSIFWDVGRRLFCGWCSSFFFFGGLDF